MTTKLFPPAVHRRNAAERAIRTFQNHFIAGLCSVDKDFPLHLWDQLLVQAELTLNLLRGSRLNPKLSSWAQVNGTFDFNRVPLAPPGCRVLIHDKPQNRTTWSPHALDGWYVGPAPDSYRCYRIWMWDTRATRICDTVSWFPSKVAMPTNSSADLILTSLQDIAHALAHPMPRSPVDPISPTHKAALQQLIETLVTLVPHTPRRASLPPAPGPAPPPLRVPIAPATDLSTVPVLANTPTITPTMDRPPLRVQWTDVSVPIANTANITPTLTYADVTGPRGKQRRRQQKRQSSPTQPGTGHDRIITQVDHGYDPIIPQHHSNLSHPDLSHDTIITPNRNSYDTVITKRNAHPIQHATPVPARNSQQSNNTCTNGTALSAIHDHAPTLTAPPLAYCFHGTAVNPDTGKIAKYRDLLQSSTAALWELANGMEIGRLFQGLGPTSDMPTGTNCCFFINKHDIPPGKKPTYIRIVCADRPEKAIPQRVRWTAGGDQVQYTGDVSTKTADVTTTKCLLNSVISTPNAKFMTLDLSDFYLESHLPPGDYEYVKIPVSLIPAHIQQLYQLAPKIIDGHVYAEIRRGMYGLPQAGRLANLQLQQLLHPHGIMPCAITPGLWKDVNSDLMFTLVVDDFGIRYTNRTDVDKLLAILATKYRFTTNWTGQRYIGLTLTWDYNQRTLDITMPGYIERALSRFQHPTPTRPQHAPHTWNAPTYGTKQQFILHDETPTLDLKDTRRVQEILGTLLYYARAVDSTMLVALGTLATQQAAPTVATLHAITHLLNYCATNPEATIRYWASDMILHVESDASYLSETKGRSRAAGVHYLSCRSLNPHVAPTANDDSTPRNGAIYVHCQILKEVLSSAAEAELAALFHNGKEAYSIRNILQELGHLQPPTPIVTDNSTASGIANDTVKQKRSKAMDMRFYWIRDRVRQGQFHVYWKQGILNRADYFTKHHSAAHHQQMRSHYLHSPGPPNYYAALDDTAATLPVSSGGEGVFIPTCVLAHERGTDQGQRATRTELIPK